MGCCEPPKLTPNQHKIKVQETSNVGLRKYSVSEKSVATLKTAPSLQQLNKENCQEKQRCRKVLNPKIQGLGFIPLVVAGTTESQIDEQLSQLVSDIVQNYDEGDKGYLKLQQFECLLRDKLKKDLKKGEVMQYLKLFQSSQKQEERTVQKFQIFALCKHIYN